MSELPKTYTMTTKKRSKSRSPDRVPALIRTESYRVTPTLTLILDAINSEKMEIFRQYIKNYDPSDSIKIPKLAPKFQKYIDYKDPIMSVPIKNESITTVPVIDGAAIIYEYQITPIEPKPIQPEPIQPNAERPYILKLFDFFFPKNNVDDKEIKMEVIKEEPSTEEEDEDAEGKIGTVPDFFKPLHTINLPEEEKDETPSESLTRKRSKSLTRKPSETLIIPPAYGLTREPSCSDDPFNPDPTKLYCNEPSLIHNFPKGYKSISDLHADFLSMRGIKLYFTDPLNIISVRTRRMKPGEHKPTIVVGMLCHGSVLTQKEVIIPYSGMVRGGASMQHFDEHPSNPEYTMIIPIGNVNKDNDDDTTPFTPLTKQPFPKTLSGHTPIVLTESYKYRYPRATNHDKFKQFVENNLIMWPYAPIGVSGTDVVNSNIMFDLNVIHDVLTSPKRATKPILDVLLDTMIYLNGPNIIPGRASFYNIPSHLSIDSDLRDDWWALLYRSERGLPIKFNTEVFYRGEIFYDHDRTDLKKAAHNVVRSKYSPTNKLDISKEIKITKEINTLYNNTIKTYDNQIDIVYTNLEEYTFAYREFKADIDKLNIELRGGGKGLFLSDIIRTVMKHYPEVQLNIVDFACKAMNTTSNVDSTFAANTKNMNAALSEIYSTQTHPNPWNIPPPLMSIPPKSDDETIDATSTSKGGKSRKLRKFRKSKRHSLKKR